MKKKQKISDLFYDNRFLFLFSVVVAICFWIVASVEFTTEVSETLTSIPVQIDYENIEKNFGLQPFGESEFTVNVKISGKKYIVDSDDISDDIVVTSSTVVSSPGLHKLKLDVSTKSERPAYEINEISTDEIEVYFDYPKSKLFLIEADITLSEDSISEEYYLGDYIFQEANKVYVSGPESQVNKIEKVVASAEFEGELTDNTTVDATLSVVTKDGSSLNYIKFNRQSEVIQITLPVYKIANLPVECGFADTPSSYINEFPFEVTIEPSSAVFGIPEKKLEGITGIEIITKNFSDLHEGVNTFEVLPTDISGVVVLDGTDKFTVTVDMGDVVPVTLETPENITFNNVPSGKTAELLSLEFSHMTIIGPQASVGEINKDNISLVADLENIDFSAGEEITVTVNYSGTDCWSYGTYNAKIKIS